MQFLLAFLVLSILFASPKVKTQNQKAAVIGDFQIPRANYGDPPPLIFGTVRQKSPIDLWHGGLKSYAVTQKVSTGLFKSKKVTTGFKYYLTLDLLLALGPGVTLKNIWSDATLVWSGSQTTDGPITINLPNLFGGTSQGGGLIGTIYYYTGSFTTARNTWLASLLDANVPAYNGFCRAVFQDFYFGTSTSLKLPNFELQRLTSGLNPTYAIMPNGYDLNPMEVMFQVLTGGWGVFNSPTADIEYFSWVIGAITLYNEGRGMSIQIQNKIDGKTFLNEVLQYIDGLMYEEITTGKLVVRLLRNDYTVGSLQTLYTSDVISLDNFEKTTWDATFNLVRVQFKNRANSYDNSVAIAPDFANINFQGGIVSTDITSVCAYDATAANVFAASQLSFLNVPLYKYKVTTTRKAANWRPGDVFVLNYIPYNNMVMVSRILEVDLGQLDDNKVILQCVQDKYAASAPVFAAPAPTQYTAPNTLATNVTTRLLFTPPHFLSTFDSTEAISTFDTAGRMYVLALAPSGASASFDALESLDNFVTDPAITLNDANYSISGSLYASYASTVGSTATLIDTSAVFRVSGLSALMIGNLKQFSTLAQAANGDALILINSEIMSYVGFVDNGDGSVTITTLYRGLLDTVPGTHTAGDRVWFLSGSDGLMNMLVNSASTAYVKLLDNTPTQTLDAATATIFSATQSGRAGLPYRPNYLTLNASRTPTTTTGATSITVAWRNRSRSNPQLAVYNDADSGLESGVQTRVRWRVGSGGYTTVNVTSGNSTTLAVTGLTGTLEVIVDSQIILNSKFSQTTDTLTMTLA